jgi:hypothetical protein
MTTKRRRTTALVLSLFLAPAWLAPAWQPAGAQDSPAAQPKEPPRDGKGKWVPLFQRHAGEYEIVVGPGTGAKAKRLTEPVLRWWQPVRGGDDGALYLWVRDGRPVAAVTFFTFKWPDGNRAIVHERHAFAQEPVEASWRDRPVWHTTQPGLTFRPVPDAPAPAATAAARLRQMQTLVPEFSANTTDSKGSDWPLRPLARPLYRYEGPTDGALFALAQGTDPEAFLLLEARGEGSTAHWEYAVTRFTDLRIAVRYKGHEVFSGPNTTGSADGIYHTSTVLQKPSDSPDDFAD